MTRKMTQARTRTAPGLHVTRKELRAAERERDRKIRKSWLGKAARARSGAMARPGARGWNRPGGGQVNYIEPAPEFRGTSVQVCGLWPFAAGSGTPVVGVPLGRHLITSSTVCADPITWFLSNLAATPSAFVLGRPGLGKSTLVRRMITVLSAWGITPMILSDLKPDYVDLVKALDGVVIRVGRGQGNVNPLDPGPLAQILDRLPEEMRRKVKAEVRGVQINTLTGLLELVRGMPLKDHEITLMSTALRLLDEQGVTVPLISDVQRLIQDPPTQLRQVSQDRGDISRYHDRTEDLMSALIALGADGPFGDTFARHTSDPIPLDGRPVVFDMSAVEDSDLKLQAALQLVCWSYGSSAVNTAKYLAEAGLAEERVYVLIMDELWRMLRAAEGMVYRVDALTRLNRQRLLGQIMITHTMNDLKLATDAMTAIAWGFVERSAMVYLGGLAEKEMGNLTEVFAMTRKESDMITDWSTEGGYDQGTGMAAAPPGLGNFLLKIGKKPGIPFNVALTPAEVDVNNTNKRWASIGARVRRRGAEPVEDLV
jgi:hypothetical protein